ncbi:hypothetical protein QJS10_CPA09g01308 [Acorus calamus]|uniref:Chorein N-terminal domain-containing protein n=1 Tax=Acorus calamus TaxID=4465 RepID=A0AAV9E6K4_ACOCL|nr:hypothetical protein QJS10_CPA09g01308 [Acorus calamus]
MESILARALEYTLKYWLKSFSRDQFKLQGRTAQLSNLDINGDALHASVGLPPALNVTTARVGKLEITLPSVSNVQIEPIIVHIDRLDLVLEENAEFEGDWGSNSTQSSTSSTKGSGYGFADKIADGMTLEVGTVNLMLETRGGARRKGGATWASPLASITIRNLLLYTTNENWEVVNLKEARDFSNNKKFIYVFKKLEWESLSVDLLPHPDMFTDARLTCSDNGENRRDDDGAKRLFFGGERFLEGISGQAHITVQRTELNSPLGLEVQLHITEAVCPALSEPGLRALLRFMTGFCMCLNRGDVDPKALQRGTDAAGRSLVSVIVDHIFLCIRDSEFQLELLMQSLFFSRATVSHGGSTENLTRVMIGGLFLRDTFSHPPCALVQPSMMTSTEESINVPPFAENFCPPIYPLGDQLWKLNDGVPLICLHSFQIKPSPSPPTFASQTIIDCQPLMINLQEESCMRIASFLADGVVGNPGAILPDFSISSFVFTVKGFDLIVPLDGGKINNLVMNGCNHSQASFSGARLHVENLVFLQSPAIKCRLLNLEKDPACFTMWEGQPFDASQKKWTTCASNLSISLETTGASTEDKNSSNSSTNLWRCVELNEACFEAAMATADGSTLVTMPPPSGVVRIGVACQQYISNTSVEQLFFVLDLYSYFGRVSEKITKVSKGGGEGKKGESLGEKLIEKLPSDTAVILAVNDLQLRFLESSSSKVQGTPLVQFGGKDLFIKVNHRTLGGAVVVSTNICWESVQVECVDGEGIFIHESGMDTSGSGRSQMRSVFWINNERKQQLRPVPFLNISTEHVMPYNAKDSGCHSLNVLAKFSGVRLGGGMNYTEMLLHRFGLLGPDGGPSEGLLKSLKNLSAGPLSKLLRASPLVEADQNENGITQDEDNNGLLELGRPDDVDVSVELRDWLFALEGADETADGWLSPTYRNVSREEKSWHMTFESLRLKAKSSPNHIPNGTERDCRTQKYPVELVTVGVEGLRALKPHAKVITHKKSGISSKSIRGTTGAVEKCGGVNLEACMVIAEEDESIETAKWAVENVKFSVKEPIEAVATKDEVEHLIDLCRSEIDSMGRIAAGILRLLKLEETIGHSTIDQLSNLGSDSLGKIFSPEKLSRRSSVGSIGYSPSAHTIIGSPHENLESTVSLLEEAILDSHAKCSSLVADFSNIEFSARHLAEVKQINQKLENMQALLSRLRTQI